MSHHVCCVMDAQFFVSNGKDVFREFSFVSKNEINCMQVDPGFLAISDAKTNWFIQKLITGLGYRPRKCYFNQNNIRPYIKKLYKRASSIDKPLVAVYNNQLCDILKELNIPHYDCPIESSCNWLCNFHHENKESHKCALNKSLRLYKALQ